VRSEKVLHRVKEERNIVHTVNRREGNWIGHILCRNCLLKQVIEGNIERRIDVKGRRGRRCKQQLNDLKEQRNIVYTVNGRKVNWIRHILCRNCLLKQVIERKIEGIIKVTGRRGIRGKKLLNDLEGKTGYWK
jgi:superfamily I DNA and RNA helicase